MWFSRHSASILSALCLQIYGLKTSTPKDAPGPHYNIKVLVWHPWASLGSPLACFGTVNLEAEGQHYGGRMQTKWGSGAKPPGRNARCCPFVVFNSPEEYFLSTVIDRSDKCCCNVQTQTSLTTEMHHVPNM